MGAASLRRWIVAAAGLRFLAQVFLSHAFAATQDSSVEQDNVQPIPGHRLGTGTPAGSAIWYKPTIADQLITVCHDKTIRFWDLKQAKRCASLRPPIGPRRCKAGFIAWRFRPTARCWQWRATVRCCRRVMNVFCSSVCPMDKWSALCQGTPVLSAFSPSSPDGKQLASGATIGQSACGHYQTLPRFARSRPHRTASMAWPGVPMVDRFSAARGTRPQDLVPPQMARHRPFCEGHTGDVMSVAWSRDGRTIATSGGTTARFAFGIPTADFDTAFTISTTTFSMLANSEDSSPLVYGWGSRNHPGRGTAILTCRRAARYPASTDTSTHRWPARFLSGGEVVATGGPPGDVFFDGKLPMVNSSIAWVVAERG